MYYPCSENKDADQLRGYREADLRLCFRPCKLLVFSRTGSNKTSNASLENQLCAYTKIFTGTYQLSGISYVCFSFQYNLSSF